jgi:ABC-type phosphate transport system substrate-binding protein
MNAQTSDNNIFVIGNNIGLQKMNIQKMKSIFRGEEAMWSNNEGVTVVLPSSKSDFSAIVAKKIFDSSPMGMKRFWLGLVFQGRANPPRFLETNEEIIAYVSKNSGSIGILFCKQDNIPTSLIIELMD